ncbi:uncharacterized protein BX663DRAFT_464434 [Cokeromyces recurvatus]|uniref:uncharacterized protein n=1 Tax=Cokeromyces recurvatus TaxID=90255 RepID=UPI00221FD63A|nr:uncharacterized protein BX663DRAFT_464434 [Cokeromyces recurvatus]KAI7907964.1 hypothetical protein BX663DRAFT_464434 [Cokeromyces recurvatus]
MGIQPRTAALITAGVAVTAGIGYMLYFDYKRRNDPTLKKKLRKEKKKAQKELKKAEEQLKSSTRQVIDSVIEAAEKEVLPSTPTDKEKYFMEKVALGEGFCNKGEAYYNEAVLPFYLALKVYPAPMELIMIYQKTVPEPVFQMIINVMAVDQQKRQNLFYEKFPPEETHVKLGELPAGKNEEGTPIVRRSLVADKDIVEGELIYTERPLVSALYPDLEGTYCNLCLKPLTTENKVNCPDCDLVAFCSKECFDHANEDYHQYICSHNKSSAYIIKEADEADEKNIALEFFETSKSKNVKYPYMIARFLSSMVAEELRKQKTEEKSNETDFGAWDHIDRFRYLETTPNDDSKNEISMLKQVLGPKVQGINEFLSDEIYLMLKGKMLYNAYGVPASSEETDVRDSDEHIRKTNSDAKYIGAGLYKISTYIGQSENAPNVKISFENDTLSVTATKDIKKGDEILASYTLPVPKKN